MHIAALKPLTTSLINTKVATTLQENIAAIETQKEALMIMRMQTRQRKKQVINIAHLVMQQVQVRKTHSIWKASKNF